MSYKGLIAVSAALLLALATITPLFSGAAEASDFAGGEGSEESPYVIETLEQLNKTRDNLDKHYILANSIDASDTEFWNGGAGFSPIGNTTDAFTGTFDGNGHAISGLHIYLPAADRVGLFGVLGSGGLIANLNLDEANVTGKDSVGILVGHASSGASIDNCHVSGNMTGEQYVGGMVGYSFGSIINSISYCFVEGTVNRVGGLMGLNHGTITGSHAAGDVNGTEYVGGLVGWNSPLGAVSGSYAAGNVSGEDSIGGLAGWNAGSIYDSFALGNVEGAGWVAGGLVGFNSGIVSGSHAAGDVTGKEEVGGLVGGSNNLTTGSYAIGKVSGDDNVGGLAGYNEGMIDSCYATGDVEGEERVGGLVGMNEGPINNSYATGDVEADHSAGGLVGDSSLEGNITGCYATGNVNSSNGPAGGLVGEIMNVVLSGCYATGDVDTTGRAGGLVGINDQGLITFCYATGTVRSTWIDNEGTGGLVGDNDGNVSFSFAVGDVYGQKSVGGLIGFTTADVKNSFALGNVHSTGTWAGGLIGEADNSEIRDCYALGEVSGNERVGGLIGQIEDSSLIRTYAAGKIDGTTEVGGLVGRNISSSDEGSYWDNESAETDASAAGVGKDTTDMRLQATFDGWDFDEVWWIAEGQTYPLLRNVHWEPAIISDPPEPPEGEVFVDGMQFEHQVEADQESSFYWTSDAAFLDFSTQGLASGTLEAGSFQVEVTPVSAFFIPGEPQTFTLTVEPAVTSIAIEVQPLLSYEHGEALDLSAMVANLTWSDGSWSLVPFADFETNDLVADPQNGTVLESMLHNNTAVKVTYDGELEAYTNDIVIAPVVTGIAVEVQPQLEYDHGDELDLSSMVANLTWSDGSWSLVPFADFGVNDLSVSLAHGTSLTVADHHRVVVEATHGPSGQSDETEALSVEAQTVDEPPAGDDEEADDDDICPLPFALMLVLGMSAIAMRRR